MKHNVLILMGLFFINTLSMGQASDLERLRNEIAYHSDVMINAELDLHRLRAQEKLESTLDSFINLEGSFETLLDSIPWLSVLHGSDFRLITWQVRISNEEYKYGGLIQWPDHVVRFRDTRPFINGSEYSTYTPSAWYGCLYYKIIPFERDKQTLYLLFGFNAENSSINTKVADVLDLAGPEPRLGVPVFIGNEEPRTRLMMTYGDITSAHMGYDEELGGIIHDHMEYLAGIGPNGEPLPVSDGSMEGWILKKGNWVYKEEVFDVKQDVPPMTDERKNFKEDKDILGRPKKQ